MRHVLIVSLSSARTSTSGVGCLRPLYGLWRPSLDETDISVRLCLTGPPSSSCLEYFLLQWNHLIYTRLITLRHFKNRFSLTLRRLVLLKFLKGFFFQLSKPPEVNAAISAFLLNDETPSFTVCLNIWQYALQSLVYTVIHGNTRILGSFCLIP